MAKKRTGRKKAAKRKATKAVAAAIKAASHSDLALNGVTGVFAVPSSGTFDVEIWLMGDNPKWSVAIGGTTDAMQPFARPIGSDQPHLKTTVTGVPAGDYAITIVATLQQTGSQFTLIATSAIDVERVDLRPLPGSPVRMAMLPTRVG